MESAIQQPMVDSMSCSSECEIQPADDSRPATPPRHDFDLSVNAMIGDRLRQRREELNLSQSQLARYLGVSFQQVQKYETGKNGLSAARLLAAARALRVPANALLPNVSGDHAMPPVPAPDWRSELASVVARLPASELRGAMLAMLASLATRSRSAAG
jgi:transcriptional regulator with XRE-family HTH domain